MRKRPKHEPTDTYFYIAIQLSNSIMRADAFNLHVDPVRTEMTGTKQIMISYVCDSDKRKSKEIIADENLLQVCSKDERESEGFIADESSTEESESERIHKSINRNKEKYAINETEHEKPSVTENPVINETRFFNLFEWGKNLLNKLDAMCK